MDKNLEESKANPWYQQMVQMLGDSEHKTEKLEPRCSVDSYAKGVFGVTDSRQTDRVHVHTEWSLFFKPRRCYGKEA